MTKKIHAANISKLFEKPDQMNNSLYEAELNKAQVEKKSQTLLASSFFNT